MGIWTPTLAGATADEFIALFHPLRDRLT